MHFIIELLVNAGMILLLSHFLPTIIIRNWKTAILVALVIGLLNATVGAVLRFPLNLLTLWLLSFFVRLLVTAVIIKIVDWIFDDFEIKGFLPALILAVALAIDGSFLSFALQHGNY
ncbi:phage holin family protein [Mucilaginibacter sp.]|uniref:phage holin family protein n=1 Tax=Mucilaginibacter sp. TaxID=1882438 RepID=UPI003B0096B6